MTGIRCGDTFSDAQAHRTATVLTVLGDTVTVRIRNHVGRTTDIVRLSLPLSSEWQPLQ